LGKAITNLSEEDDNSEMRGYLNKQIENIFAQTEAQTPWESHEEQVELIGVLTEGLFDIIVFEEISVIWEVVMKWNETSCGRNDIIL